MLSQIYRRMVASPNEPGGPTRPDRAGKPKVERLADLRISGASANPRSESDIRLNYGDPSLVIAAANDLDALRPSRSSSRPTAERPGAPPAFPAGRGDIVPVRPRGRLDVGRHGLGADARRHCGARTSGSTRTLHRQRRELDVRDRRLRGADRRRPRDHLGRPQPDLAVQGPGLRGLAHRHAGLLLAPHRRCGRHLVGATAGQRRRDHGDRHRRRRQDQRQRRRLRLLAGRGRQPEHRLRQVRGRRQRPSARRR